MVTRVASKMGNLLSLANQENFEAFRVPGATPLYETELGAAYLGDSLELLKKIPDSTIGAVITSPPYALHFKKEYGNASKAEYLEWIKPFAKEIFRVLKDDGSFVLNIGGSYNPKVPTRSLYQYKVLISLVEEIGFHLAQEFFWYNPAKMPVPAEWVTVRRIRVKDSVENVWWLSKTAWPKANNRNVLKPYSPDMERLNKRGLSSTIRPSGHHIKESFSSITHGGSIPPNIFEEQQQDNWLKFGNNGSNDQYTKKCKESEVKIHPARFPSALPEFFIKLLTDESDVIVDPFAGSNTTGSTCEKLNRQWLALELDESYLSASKFRFE